MGIQGVAITGPHLHSLKGLFLSLSIPVWPGHLWDNHLTLSQKALMSPCTQVLGRLMDRCMKELDQDCLWVNNGLQK